MNQQGAALVIVMALLAGSMTLGLSGMQTALVDERLAGNYRASTQAQMNAEEIAAELLSDVGEFYNSAGAMDCEAFKDAYPADRNYQNFVQIDSLEESGQFVSCEGSVNERLFLIEGVVGSIENPLARHLLKVGQIEPGGGGGEVPFPEELAGYALMAGGAIDGITPSSDVDGRFADNLGLQQVPDPRDEHPSDESRTGFISSVRDKAFSGDSDTIEACNRQDVQNAKSSNTKYVYCSLGFNGDIDSSFDGLTIVSEASISKLNVKGNVQVSLISGNSISLKGFGNNQIRGVLWAAGSISLQGSSNVVGGIYSNGAIDFSGKTSLKADDEPFDDAGGGSQPIYVWDS